jgi:hypothetical protein
MIFNALSDYSFLSRRNTAANNSWSFRCYCIKEIRNLMKSYCQGRTINNQDGISLHRELIEFILKSIRLILLFDNEKFLGG